MTRLHVMTRLMMMVTIISIAVLSASQSLQAQTPAHLGFDRNTSPGDANLKALHETFSYTGFWLNHPPGEKTNSWIGHRAAVKSAGFGFLVLFNGRLYAELKTVAKPTPLGQSDAQAAPAPPRRTAWHQLQPRRRLHRPENPLRRAPPHRRKHSNVVRSVGRPLEPPSELRLSFLARPM